MEDTKKSTEVRNTIFRVQEEALRYKRAMMDENTGMPDVEELKKSIREKLTHEEMNLIGSLMMSAFTEGGIFCAKDPSRVPAFLQFYDNYKGR